MLQVGIHDAASSVHVVPAENIRLIIYTTLMADNARFRKVRHLGCRASFS
jgi:hypothetical protein